MSTILMLYGPSALAVPAGGVSVLPELHAASDTHRVPASSRAVILFFFIKTPLFFTADAAIYQQALLPPRRRG